MLESFVVCLMILFSHLLDDYHFSFLQVRSEFVSRSLLTHSATRTTKPKLLPAACRPSSVTTACMNAGGARSRRTAPQETPAPRTRGRMKPWTEGCLSPGFHQLEAQMDWTLMRLCFCLSLTLPVRPSRGHWGRSRSGWPPWFCSTARPREGSRENQGRNRRPAESHQKLLGPLVLSSGRRVEK